MNMNWSDAYLDIPFRKNGRSHDGCDCYGLLCLVYGEQLGITLPPQLDVAGGHCAASPDYSIADIVRIARAVALQKDRLWVKVDRPRPFDAVLLRIRKYVWHMGVLIGRRWMIHVAPGINSAVEDLAGPLWYNRVEEYRRYGA
jgi:cell wall-associated NlpC family hydrolase